MSGADVVIGSLVAVVVDMGANVDVVDVSSPEADLHPAVSAATATTSAKKRSICIGPGCYGRWREKRFFVLGTVGMLKLALPS